MERSRILEKSYYLTYTYQTDIESIFKENNIDKYIILNNQLAVIYVPLDFNENLLNDIYEITWWHESNPMSSLIEITNNLSTGETITRAAGTDYIYNNPYNTTTGEGIIIAIIDSGIDYLHPDFRKLDGSSKILRLWDQEGSKGSPPEGMIFGSEFTREDINQAIESNDSSLSVDSIGTGTIAAGIVAGEGNVNPQYKGITSGSDLVVVKLRSYTGTYHSNRVNYTISDFLAAITYVIDIATKENKPMIINLTVGTASEATADTTILDTYGILNKAGTIIVSGAGNEGNTDIHYEGRISDVNDVQDITFQVGDDTNLSLMLMTTGPDKIGAMLISPSGEVSYNINYAPDNPSYRGRFNLEKTDYELKFIYPWIDSGTQRLEIKLLDVKPGVWTLRLTPEFILNGGFDVYLPNKNLISQNTRFLDPSSLSTITRYGIGDTVITIGAYDDKTDSMWIGSSKGPVKGRGIKPDIVAPGVDIISTYSGGGYNTATGTGVSGSIVSGVLALIMEYLLQETPYSRLSLFNEVLKSYLMLGSTQKDIYTYPNVSQGYGILNLKDTFEQIAKNL